jgi:hypothetical protein
MESKEDWDEYGDWVAELHRSPKQRIYEPEEIEDAETLRAD